MHEITDASDLPVTNKQRTLIDLLRTEPLFAARDLLDRAIQQDWLSPFAIEAELRGARCRTGNVRLRELLAGLEPGAHAESERVLHRLLRRAGVSGWVPQYRVKLTARTAYLDVAFPSLKLAIEIDGKLGHDAHSDRFDDDRARQNELVGAGWVVLRFTWQQLNHRSEWVVQQIVQHLAA
jgi:very-short-patch-repair endonuclease